MSSIDLLRACLASIAQHRLRSLLTALGIIIGVASVVTVVGLMRGFSAVVSRQFDEMGGNSLTIRARNELRDVLYGKVNKLRFSDVAALQTHARGIVSLSPLFGLGATPVRKGQGLAHAQLFAATPNYQEVNRRYVAAGRFIAEADELSARRVAVIGDKLIDTLKLQGDPVGQYIHFRGEWFAVIGVMEHRGEIFGISQDEFIVIPYKTGRMLLGQDQQPEIVIGVGLKPQAADAEVRRELTRLMRAAHRLKPGAKDDFEVVAADQLRKTFETLSDSFTLVAAGIVGLSLLVGGVGIMNIMLVCVAERTREIGILKAIGARRRDILGQFVVEAMLLSGIGGLVGLACAGALVGLTAWLVPAFPADALPWWIAPVAILLAASLGMVFGVGPASRAAGLEPLEALRAE